MTCRVYIAGKISNGNDKLSEAEYQEVFDKFQKIEKELLNAGFEVRNPMKYVSRNVVNWQDTMKICIPILCQCNAIYLIGDFNESRGARMMYSIANKLIYKHITSDILNEKIRINKLQFKPQSI